MLLVGGFDSKHNLRDTWCLDTEAEGGWARIAGSQRWRNDFGFGFVRPVFPLNEWKQMIMELESVIFRNSLCEWLPPIRMVASMRFVMTWWCLVHITR